MTHNAYIFDAVRTPRGKGKKGGALNEVKPIDLLSKTLNSLQSRTSLDTSRVDDVVIGCVTPIGEQGSNIGKTATIVAGWDESVAGVQLDRFCASGLEAVNFAAMKVASGWEDLVVAGGVECMSRVPMGSNGGAWGQDPWTSYDTTFVPQGVGADLIATLEGFTREDVDGFAVHSQNKAAQAWEKGYFNKSIVPVYDDQGILIADRDEHFRAGSSIEGLSSLKPSFEFYGSLGYDDMAISKYPQVSKINHVHHAGNSSGIVDGATAILIGNEKIGKELGLQPRARVVSTAVVGSEPTIMLTGPAPAALKALQKAGLTVDDIDLFEVNEAFASVVMKFQKDLSVPSEKVNVNGGSIALGHPLGATGGIIVGTIIDELERRGLRYGLCTLCVGAGMGIATIIERV
jgi:acetyl-CoA C-acetyltransferase